MKEKNNNKGITLVALIITIIVLLLLAVVVINEVKDGGIIAQAKNAQQEYKNADNVEKDILEYYSDFLNAKGDLGPWKQTNDKISMIDEDGKKIELKIGDYINYTTKTATYTSYGASGENNQGRTNGYGDQVFKTDDYTGGWRVLGVKDGKLQLVSADIVVPSEGGVVPNNNPLGINFFALKVNEIAYRYSIDEFNAICNIYGNGDNAESGRCINIDDINKITGYDPKNTGINHDEGAFLSGSIYGYENEVTFYWDGTDYPYYESQNGEKGNLQTSHSATFYGLEDNKIVKFDKPIEDVSTDNKQRIIKMKSDYYMYYPETLSSTQRGEMNTVWYEMLFKDTDTKFYWLASRCTLLSNIFEAYGLRSVYGKGVDENLFLNSDGNSYINGAYAFCLRPVITLKSSTKLVKNENNHWEFAK